MITTDPASGPATEAAPAPRSSRRDAIVIALVLGLLLVAIGIVVFGGMPVFGADPMAGT